MTGQCLEPHDLAAAKLVAGREKDLEFLVEMVRHGLLEEEIMRSRIGLLAPEAGQREDLVARWNRIKAAAVREYP